jgi:hypothetical protein
MPKVVFLNGPKNCGKDTAASFLGKHNIAVVHKKFSTPLKRGVHAMFSVPYSCEEAEHRFGKEWKDTPQGVFYGNVPRDMYIWYSEEVMKPKFGVDIFGNMAAAEVAGCGAQKLVVFSDSGFAEEAMPIIKFVGKQNCLLINIERPGCDFAGDSRSYIELPIKTITVNNRFELFMYEMQIVRAVYPWAGLPEPEFKR